MILDAHYPQPGQPKLTIEYEPAVTALKNAVYVMGEDYVYEPEENEALLSDGCVYFDVEGQPSCLIGHVLSDLGMTSFEPESVENSSSVSTLIARGVLKVDDIDPLSGSSKTAALLAYGQSLNDNRSPWGEAVTQAIDYASKVDH